MRAATLALCLLLGPTAAAESAIPNSPDQIRPLLIGQQAPSLTLADAAGESFDLDAAIAAKPTLLIFYRGGW